MIICVDFDGVLHDIDNPIAGRRMGAPILGAKEALEELSKDNEIVIFTVRATDNRTAKVVEDWMDYFEIPYHSITNVKINADVYIDDKAIHFTSWTQTMLELELHNRGHAKTSIKNLNHVQTAQIVHKSHTVNYLKK